MVKVPLVESKALQSMYRAVNLESIQTLRIDRDGMIDDIITHNTPCDIIFGDVTLHLLRKKYSLTLLTYIFKNLYNFFSYILSLQGIGNQKLKVKKTPSEAK